MFTPRDPAEDLSKQVLEQFRIFANAERNRISERKRLQALLDLDARRSRAAKTNDLLIFSKTFKSNSRLPSEVIDAATNDALQQRHNLEHDDSPILQQSSTWTTTAEPDSTDAFQTTPKTENHVLSPAQNFELATRRITAGDSRSSGSTKTTPIFTVTPSTLGASTSNNESIFSRQTRSTTFTSVLEDALAKNDNVAAGVATYLSSITEEVPPPGAAFKDHAQDPAQSYDNQSLISVDSSVVLTLEQQEDIINIFAKALIGKVSIPDFVPRSNGVSVAKFQRSLAQLLTEYTGALKNTTPGAHRFEKRVIRQIQILRNPISSRCASALTDGFVELGEQRTHPEIVEQLEAAHLSEKTWEEKIGDWKALLEDEANTLSPRQRDHATFVPTRGDIYDDFLPENARTPVELSSYSRSISPVSACSSPEPWDRPAGTSELLNSRNRDYSSAYAYLTGHEAFKTLTDGVERLVERDFSDMMGLIRHRVLLSIGRSMDRCIYHGHLSSLALMIDGWDIRAYLKKYYDCSPAQDLGSVITVTGHDSEAYLTTVRGYIQQTWRGFPLILLDTIQAAISSGFHSSSVEGMESNSVIVDLDRQKVVITGSAEFIVVLAQQLTWMTACCQINSSTLCCSHVFFRENTSQHDSTYPLFQIAIETTPIAPSRSGDCWIPLLESSVIASGFPIPERPNHETGLEIPLEIMAALGGTQVAVEYKGGYVLKGRSIMFVPVERTQQSVQWHLFQKSKGRMQFKDVSDMCPRRLLTDALDEQAMLQTRAFLGWCPRSKNNLGKFVKRIRWLERDHTLYCRLLTDILATKMFNYSNVDFSSTKRPSKSFINLVGGSLGFQYFGACSLDFTIGKGTAPFSTQNSTFFRDRLDDAQQIPVILQDMSSRRAWQTDGERAILQFLLHRENYGFHNVDGRQVRIKTADANEAEYVRQTMLRNADTILNEDYRADNSRMNFKLFKDVFYELCGVLEGMQAHLEEAQSAGMRLRIDRSQLVQGYEYMDLVHRKHRVHLKEKLLYKTCGGWPDFAREIEAVVLFGADFGEVIQPKSNINLCERFKSVPRDQDYLTIEGATLHELFIQSGAGSDHSQLTTTGRKWHRSLQLFEPCSTQDHDRDGSCTCQRIQTLLPGRLASFRRCEPPGELPPTSAAIFGRTSSNMFASLLNGPMVRAEENRISSPFPMTQDSSVQRKQLGKKSVSWHEWRTKAITSEASVDSLCETFVVEEDHQGVGSTPEDQQSPMEVGRPKVKGMSSFEKRPLTQGSLVEQHNTDIHAGAAVAKVAAKVPTLPPTKSFKSRITDGALPWSQPNVNFFQDGPSRSMIYEAPLYPNRQTNNLSYAAQANRSLRSYSGIAKEPSMPAIDEQAHASPSSPSEYRLLQSRSFHSSPHVSFDESQPRSLRRKPNFVPIARDPAVTE